MEVLQQLKGHKGMVHSLQAHPQEPWICSASEDGTARIWDLNSMRTTKAVKLPGGIEAMSACFHPTQPLLYVAGGPEVFTFDLRADKLILDEVKAKYGNSEGEEINEVTVNDKGKYLAFGDDNGEVTVIDIEENKPMKKLMNGHKNICSTVKFRKGKPWELISGGMDNQFIHWDFSKGTTTEAVNTLELTQQGGRPQIINPPFVNSIDISHDGKSFALALGNGTVALFDGSKKGDTYNLVFLEKHTFSVSQVNFARFDPTSKLICSGALDCNVYLWNTQQKEPSPIAGHKMETKVGALCTSKLGHVFAADETNNITVLKVQK